MLVRERVSAEESALTNHPRSAASASCPRVGRPRVVSLTPFLALRSSLTLARSCSFSHANPPFRRAVLSKQRERLCPLVPAVKPGRILNSRHFIAFAIYRRAARPKDVVLSLARFISRSPPDFSHLLEDKILAPYLSAVTPPIVADTRMIFVAL